VAKADDMSLFARIAMVYGALFFSVGMFMPFFPVWLKSQAGRGSGGLGSPAPSVRWRGSYGWKWSMASGPS